jgi:hypothetical protein
MSDKLQFVAYRQFLFVLFRVISCDFVDCLLSVEKSDPRNHTK